MEPTMTQTVADYVKPPNHLQLPDKDGTFVINYQEPPQSDLLTGSLEPRLAELHPDGLFSIGRDNGIYWRSTTPPLDGCKAPDWFYVPGVPRMLDGDYRRSYVLWEEGVPPALVIEYVSGDGKEEHDRTPYKGKFWVYEQGIGAANYVIFDGAKKSVELYRLNGRTYVPVPANAAGRYPVPELRIELGIWEGCHQGMTLPWLRVWDESGALLPSTEERELAQRQRADAEKTRADAEKARADTAESLGDETRQLWQEECERAETERKRANAAEQEATAAKANAQRLAERLRALGVNPDDA